MSQRDPLTKITETIYQLRLPLPFALNHVNVYLLRGSNGWTIIDCGINWEQGRQTWQDAFAQLKIRGRDLEQIVLTHVHPDHFGLAGWLQAFAAADGREIPVRCSPREAQQAQIVWLGNADMDFAAWLRQNGVPEAMANSVDSSMADTYQMTLPHPRPLEFIHAGEQIQMGDQSYTLYHAPGHSDGQLLFYDEAEHRLFSGDHVLMKITPNIGLWENTDPNPLGMFMDSLRHLRELSVRQALPGHRQIIEDWAGRIDEIVAHHEHRLSEVLDAVASGAHSPYEVTGKIFDVSRFTAHEWRFAIAETLAHLEFLRVDAKLQQAEQDIYFELIS